MSLGLTTLRVLSQGCIGVITEACISLRTSEVVLLRIDLSSKNAEVVTRSDHGDPTVIFGSGNQTSKLVPEESPERMTTVSIPEFSGWKIWSMEKLKYGVNVCLTRRDLYAF